MAQGTGIDFMQSACSDVLAVAACVFGRKGGGDDGGASSVLVVPLCNIMQLHI
jgi:hypothetical protein